MVIVCTNWSGLRQQRIAQRIRPIQLDAVQVAIRFDHRSRFAIFRAPGADRIEVLEREAQRIDDAVAGVAGRVLAVSDHALAHGLRQAARVFLERFHAWRRSGGRRARICSRTHAPRRTGEVRFA